VSGGSGQWAGGKQSYRLIVVLRLIYFRSVGYWLTWVVLNKGPLSRLLLLIQVKKMMNVVYRRIRAEFSPDVEYKSSEIDAVVLSVIKVRTNTL